MSGAGEIYLPAPVLYYIYVKLYYICMVNIIGHEFGISVRRRANFTPIN